MAAKEITTIKDLSFDPQNANLGTERGDEMLGDSLHKYGAGRGVVADKNGVMIGGNKTLAKALAQGFEIVPIHTDGSKLVVTIRDDLDLMKDPEARELAFSDNRTGEVNLFWSKEQIDEALKDPALDIRQLWTAEEIEAEFSRVKLMGNGYNGGADEEVQEGDEMSRDTPLSEQPRIPLSIVLNTMQARQWQEYKESVEKQTDTAAFLILLAAIQEERYA